MSILRGSVAAGGGGAWEDARTHSASCFYNITCDTQGAPEAAMKGGELTWEGRWGRVAAAAGSGPAAGKQEAGGTGDDQHGSGFGHTADGDTANEDMGAVAIIGGQDMR